MAYTPPTFVASYASVFNTSTTPKTVSVTTQAGDVVVVYAVLENGNATGFSATTPSGNSITFTSQQQVHINNSWTDVGIWTGTDATGGTSWTLSLSASGLSGQHWGVGCMVFRGSDGIGVSNKANASAAAPSVSLTTTQDNSAIVVVSGDWDADDGSSRTWRTVNSITPTNGNGLEKTYSFDSGVYTAYAAYYNDAGAAGSKTVGLTAPSSQTYSIAAVEIKGTTTSSVVRNSAEGQSDGTTLTAANSGGGSGRAFDNVDTTGTVTGVFSSAQGMHGSFSYAINASASSTKLLAFGGQNDALGAQQAYFYFTAYPSGTCAIMAAYSTDTKSTVTITSDGRFRVYDDVAQIDESAASAVPLNSWVRIDMITTIGATTSTGRIQVKASTGDTMTTLYNYDSGTTVNTGTANITSYRYGKLDSTPSFSTFYVDDLAFFSSSSSFINPLTATAVVGWFVA